MTRKLIATEQNYVSTVLRVVLGVAMFPHGAQKLLGWFGGAGLEGTIAFFGQAWGIPAVLTVAIVLTEFFGGIALILGVAGRAAATGIAAIMLGAVSIEHFQHGFFMNWTGAQPGEGVEYHLLVVAVAVAIAITGSGALSVDRVLSAPVRNGDLA